MKKIFASVIGIDQGVTELFSEFESGGDMWVGSGPRERIVKVKFSKKFKQIPAVHASLKMMDAAAGHNYRFDLLTGSVSKGGFVLMFKTWEDTKIARASASWMAIGELADEANWDT